MGLMTSVAAGGERCACLAPNPPQPESKVVFELAATERPFYNQLIKTSNVLLRPLQKSGKLCLHKMVRLHSSNTSLLFHVSNLPLFSSMKNNLSRGLSEHFCSHSVFKLANNHFEIKRRNDYILSL